MPTPGNPPPVKDEPKTALGNFYRAHRTEVLGGAGLVVAVGLYWRSKHPSSSSSTASTSSSDIDAATGYPAGSAEDIAALQAQAAAASGAGVVSPSSPGDGSSTGYGDGGGTGYSGSGGLSSIDAELASIETTLTNNGTLDQPPPPAAPGPAPGSGSSPAVGVAGGKTGPTVSNAQNLANLDATLARDEKGTSAGDKASVTTLKKQIAAVKARS